MPLPLISRTVCGFAVLALLAACATPSSTPRYRAVDEPAPELVAAEDMFATAIEEICFGALARGQLPQDRLAFVDYEELPSAAARYRSTPDDRLYRARNVSSPVLVSVAPGIARCDVIAVKGDRPALRQAAENVLDRYDPQEREGLADYLAAIDHSPNYAVKFTLRSGDLVDDPDTPYAADPAYRSDDPGTIDDPFAITE
ncbi:hypothetical protein [Aquisalinus flavus]|uniref:Lipoprotein n=1 Tax=Aquisalinus flavus TaxID=1526572 RepID=A0A8J2V7B2_9PROT|nr:hypothetical protein [Aquisalinus flavus]MBD0425277.1 hypothetical protein [Aquisalinus flavus]UNE49070.1 hypothetical protein FF099_13910 [Aquisalinus flavus]GGD17324.1 hypothetical protein GCM10011342_27680 [Aquisalinus flavus]